MSTLSLLLILLVGSSCYGSSNDIITKNMKLYVNDIEFFIKALCYSPVMLGQAATSDGTGGGFCSPKVSPYGTTTTTCYDSDYFDGGPNAAGQPQPPGGGWFQPVWERDFQMMKQLGANTLRLYSTNPTTKQASIYYPQVVPLPLGKDHIPFMDMAAAYNFKIIFPLIGDYGMLTTYDAVTFKRLLRWQIDEVGNHPSLLMWAFGNELPLAGNPALISLLNVYITYIKQYTLTKWGRKVPVTTAVVDLPNSYDSLAATLDVDIFTTNAGYRGFSFSDLWSGNADTQGWYSLSCRYNKPVFIGELGWQSLNNAITFSNPDWFNQIWKDLVGHMDQGCIGGAFFEYSDERLKPAEQQTMGLVSLSVNNSGGLPSTQPYVWNVDVATPKDIIFNAVKSGSYQGVFYNMNSSPFYLTGRPQTTSATSASICAAKYPALKDCPAANTCSFHGICDRQYGTCSCNTGWTGSDCSQAICVGSCSGNGACVGAVSPPVCNCNAGWTGPSCNVATSSAACSSNCASLNGRCDAQGICRCYAGWWGHDCAIPDTSYPPSTPITTPAAPTSAPAAPTIAPAAPTPAPAAPTSAPASPTRAPAAPTSAPAAPTSAPAAPTSAPASPTRAPAAPTSAPAAPTPAPAVPTSAPAAPTSAPVAPTSAPAAPTPAPAAPTPAGPKCSPGLRNCGQACYDPNQYVCYNNGLMCPTTNQLCGTSCYDPKAYSCSNGQLAHV